ncbi:MAG: PD-(D/E)XK nuclease family protein [Verrucomicrobiae bacterium]|nr:PD-(D/E)XK nuclease family protein [Verrucomicrobiae bacterium]
MHANADQAENLFERLFSYSPRPGRTPLEDYCTEALAWCLLKSPSFRQQFLHRVDSNRTWGEVDVATQYSYRTSGEEEEAEATSDAGRFDLLITSRDSTDVAVVIESKVDADFGYQQLSRYSKSPALRKYTTTTVVTLLKYASKPKGATVHVRWAEVQQMLAGTGTQESAASFLQQFADFLKRRGLYPMKLSPITVDKLGSLECTMCAIVEMKQILEAVATGTEVLGSKRRARFDLGTQEAFHRSWVGYRSVGGAPWFWMGFVFDHKRKETVLWVDMTIEKDRRNLKAELPKEVRAAFKLLPQYLRTGEPSIYVNTGALNEGKNTTFGFVQPMPNPETPDPEEVARWFEETLKGAHEIASLARKQ